MLRHTAVLYEAPGRTADTLRDLVEAGAGARGCAVARELTKQFEEVRRGTVAELAEYYAQAAPRGEVVIVLGGATAVAPDEGVMRSEARRLRDGGASARDVAAELGTRFGVARNLAYRLAQEAGDVATDGGDARTEG